MSDATLPALPPAPTAADPLLTTSFVPNSSEDDAYPFLIHSQQSIINGSSPELDNGKLARQKRKRTSPEDQVTLEAEYKRNPKPDKAARGEILKKVSLGEKEVQIWFQNRRQNTRRKTRPLLPHEIAAFGLGGMVALSSSPVLSTAHGASRDAKDCLSTYTSNMPNDNQEQPHSSDDFRKVQHTPTSSESRESSEKTKANEDISVSHLKSIDISTQPQLRTNIQSFGHPNISEEFSSSQALPATFGYLANRRNARADSLSISKSSLTPMSTASLSQERSPPSSCPENISGAKTSTPSTSQVRLSLSLDGKAELISSQVSPPRHQHMQPSSSAPSVTHARLSLKRCQSDITSSNASRKISSHIPSIPRLPGGRSRDARTWEFCCDTDARDELTTQAENESSGSAVAAISLLRSTSTSNLKSGGSKRNPPLAKSGPLLLGKKPKLVRASSSLPRLQSSNKTLLVSPSGDSDKENWLPQDTSSNSRRRNHVSPPHQKQKRRRVLQESKTGFIHRHVLACKNIAPGMPTFTGAEVFEDGTTKGKADREVDRFMRGEVSPSKKGDLDCIQGLLSLSQGTWR